MGHFIPWHDHMGELQIGGKSYFLKQIRVEESTDNGHQTWLLEDVATGKDVELEYLPNQHRKAEHDAKMRALTSRIASVEIGEVITQLHQQQRMVESLNKAGDPDEEK